EKNQQLLSSVRHTDPIIPTHFQVPGLSKVHQEMTRRHQQVKPGGFGHRFALLLCPAACNLQIADHERNLLKKLHKQLMLVVSSFHLQAYEDVFCINIVKSPTPIPHHPKTQVVHYPKNLPPDAHSHRMNV